MYYTLKFLKLIHKLAAPEFRIFMYTIESV